MTLIIALVGLLALMAMLVRTIATDGYGSRPTPRSHQEEMGSWIDQQFTQ